MTGPAAGQLPVARDASARSLELPAGCRVGPRGFPLCRVCGRESIGPQSQLCFACWTPELDPAGWASWRAICAGLGLPL